MKSQNAFFKNINGLNVLILTEFISKYLPDIIIKILNSHEIIMIEINKNKKIIADELLQISTFEEKENKLKINNKNLKDELNKTKIKLNKQIDEQKKNFLEIVNNKE